VARDGRVDLLCIDELGYMELDRRGAELSSRASPNAKRRIPPRSPPTSPSPAGPMPSPTHACAAIIDGSSTDGNAAYPQSRAHHTPDRSLFGHLATAIEDRLMELRLGVDPA